MSERINFKSPNNLSHELIHNHDGYSLLVRTKRYEHQIPLISKDPVGLAYRLDEMFNTIYETLGGYEYMFIIKKFKRTFDRIKYKNDFTFMRDLYFESFQRVSKKQQRELKPDDIIGIEYVVRPMPSTRTISTRVGYFDGYYVSDTTEQRVYIKKISENDFLKLREDLISIYKIQEWNRSYNDYYIIDGHHYQIVFYLKNDKILHIYGANAYPKYFEEFIRRLGLETEMTE
jgi:hypothetical protein